MAVAGMQNMQDIIVHVNRVKFRGSNICLQIVNYHRLYKHPVIDSILLGIISGLIFSRIRVID